jgi:GNAT superfamily N-acetyltransferase
LENQFIIRMATPQDGPALLPLLAQLGYPTTLAEIEQRLLNFSRLPKHGVAIALSADKIIGWVAWSATHPFITDQMRFRVEGLVIDQHYRRHGIGKQLMHFVETFAQQWQPAMIELTSSVKRAQEGTHAFYQSIGYNNEGQQAKWYARKAI